MINHGIMKLTGILHFTNMKHRNITLHHRDADRCEPGRPAEPGRAQGTGDQATLGRG